MLVTVSFSILILYINAQVGLYYMKLWHEQYVVREMMHNPVSFINVGPLLLQLVTHIILQKRGMHGIKSKEADGGGTQCI